MEHPRVARKAASHGMLHNRYSAQSRYPMYDSHSARLLQEPRRTQENTGPRQSISAVQSMLKTSTESGDIGIFSIKPPRAQRQLSHQTSLQQLRARRYGHAHGDLIQYPPPGQFRNRDDRRRLPSYNRATPADSISLYETESQKSSVSSKVLEEPVYRSYSMTHTSHSSYTGTLSNHKSYTSLRSQPDLQPQRPRSPFPYPARLKRPGFRPSSPVLTDGAIDYSRRAEIERILPAATHVNGNSSSSSPSSLYAQNRLPPLRNDTNKLAQSMLGPSSPLRRQKSPPPIEDTPKRVLPRVRKPHHLTQDHPSPTRNTFNSSSTTNLYQPGPPASASNTPGRVPPSPKYYDYTEDFYPEEQLSSSPIEPPPRFQLERTIHEDRPLSATWSESNQIDAKTSHIIAVSPRRQVQLSNDATDIPNAENDRCSIPPPVPDKDTPEISQNTPCGQSTRSSTIDSLEHIVQMYENNRMPSHPLQLGPSRQERLRKDHSAWSSLQDSFDFERDKHIPSGTDEYPDLKEEVKMPSPDESPVNHGIRDCEPETKHKYQNSPVYEPSQTVGDMVASHLKPSPHPSYDASILFSLPNGGRYDGQLPQRSTSSQSVRFRSSKLFSDSNGLQGLAQMLASYQQYQPGCGPAVPPKQQAPSIRRAITTTKPAIPKNYIDKVHLPLSNPLKPVVQAYNGFSGAVPNYSHQIPPKTNPSHEIPMLAPKPISPARQLKLKNSIPQLMKALPTLPKDQKDDNVRAFSPPSRQTSIEITLPFRFSPLFLEPRATTTMIPGSDEQRDKNVYQIAAQPTTPPPPPKLKLKRRPSGDYRPKSSNSSQPWNIDENYPWTAQAPSVHLASIINDEPIILPKRQKFKLKIARPPKSSFGTVLVNKEAGASKKQVVFDLKSHRDLFTPHNGLDHVFRGMKRHFSSRRLSASDQNTDTPGIRVAATRRGTLRSRSHENLSTASREGPVHLHIQTPAEVQSFFSDDSSQAINYSLRRRLSHLRARLPAPYASKSGAHSYDDILWRERSADETQLITRTKTKLDTMNINETDGVESLEHQRTRRLRAKVSGWLEKARTAMAAVVKTGKSTEWRQRKMYSGV